MNANCKFCGKPITIEVDEIYAQLGDPNKLYRLASCQRCGEFMSERNRLFRLVGKQARMLCQGGCEGNRLKAEDLEKIREILRHDLKAYLKLQAAHRSLPVPEWEEAILDSIMDNPGQFGNVLQKLTEMTSKEGMLI